MPDQTIEEVIFGLPQRPDASDGLRPRGPAEPPPPGGGGINEIKNHRGEMISLQLRNRNGSVGSG